MKKRTMAGGVVGLGIIIGLMLNGLFFGIGGSGGDGTDENSNASSENTSANDSEIPKDTLVTASPSVIAGSTIPSPTSVNSASGKALHILIDDRSFSIRQIVDGQETYKTVEIAEILDAAKASQSNDDGIRIFIARKKSARTTAEIQLKEELTKIGIADDAIIWQEELVP